MAFRSIIAGVFAAALAAIPSFATVLVDQPGYENGAGAISSGANRAFDDFILPGNYTVTTVSWLGWTTAPASTFKIGFGTTTPPFFPNTNLFSDQTVTVTGTAFPAAPWNSIFSATLPVPVNLMAGTGYWISIYGNNGFWGWGQGDGSTTTGVLPHGLSAIDLPGGIILAAIDLAFTLEGDPTVTPPPPSVPEPLTLTLFGAGLGVMGLRRKKAKA